MMNKLTIVLFCVCIALSVAWLETVDKLHEAQQTIDRQERQLKELYGQVNEVTLQYVGIVRRLQEHAE